MYVRGWTCNDVIYSAVAQKPVLSTGYIVGPLTNSPPLPVVLIHWELASLNDDWAIAKTIGRPTHPLSDDFIDYSVLLAWHFTVDRTCTSQNVHVRLK